MHTLVGAGGAAGTGDAANLLKPALARGNLRTIGATTWAEYKKYIEKDPALTRRFQVVQVPEPDEVKAILMLRGVASVLEKHHRVQLLDEAIEAAVKLSHRYIPARQLPDKAVSLLDTACARVAVSQHATPAEVEDCRRRIEALEIEIGDHRPRGGHRRRRRPSAQATSTRSSPAERERAGGARRALAGREGAGRPAARAARAAARRQQAGRSARGRRGRQPSTRPAGDGRRSGTAPIDRADAAGRAARACRRKLAALQGESPLILPVGRRAGRGRVVADWTGIPVGRMVKNEIEAVLKLAEALGAARDRPGPRAWR